MSNSSNSLWTHAIDAVLAVAMTISLAVGGYYVNQLDARDKLQNARLDDYAYRITRNEKDLEYAIRRFDLIDGKLESLDEKLDILLEKITRHESRE